VSSNTVLRPNGVIFSKISPPLQSLEEITVELTFQKFYLVSSNSVLSQKIPSLCACQYHFQQFSSDWLLYIHICMCVCIYICMRVCIYICIYSYIFIFSQFSCYWLLYIHICMCVCIYICMRVCIYICIYLYIHFSQFISYGLLFVHICMCVRIYIYIYLFIYSFLTIQLLVTFYRMSFNAKFSLCASSTVSKVSPLFNDYICVHTYIEWLSSWKY